MYRYLALAFTLAFPAAALGQTTPLAETPLAASPVAVTLDPQVNNLAKVFRAVEAEYPSDLRNARIRATVHVRMMVDTAGVPSEFAIARSSGNRRFDAAAMRVSALLRYHPATVDGKAVPLPTTVPIGFVPKVDSAYMGRGLSSAWRAGSGAAPVGGSSEPVDDAEVISFAYPEEGPRLLNRILALREMDRLYLAWPRLTRLSGTADLMMIIGKDGVPISAHVTRGSGNSELDAAALEVGRAMRFSPSRINNNPVPVEIEMPITIRASKPADSCGRRRGRSDCRPNSPRGRAPR